MKNIIHTCIGISIIASIFGLVFGLAYMATKFPKTALGIIIAFFVTGICFLGWLLSRQMFG